MAVAASAKQDKLVNESTRIRLRSLARSICGKYRTDLVWGDTSCTDGKTIWVNPRPWFFNDEMPLATRYCILRAVAIHEALHILFTDFAPWKEFQTDPELTEYFHPDVIRAFGNGLEDSRIEFHGSQLEEGAKKWLRLSNVTAVRSMPVPKELTGAVIRGFVARAVAGILPPGFAEAWPEVVDYLDEIEPLIETGRRTLTTADCLAYAKEMLLRAKRLLPKYETPEFDLSDLLPEDIREGLKGKKAEFVEVPGADPRLKPRKTRRTSKSEKDEKEDRAAAGAAGAEATEMEPDESSSRESGDAGKDGASTKGAKSEKGSKASGKDADGADDTAADGADSSDDGDDAAGASGDSAGTDLFDEERDDAEGGEPGEGEGDDAEGDGGAGGSGGDEADGDDDAGGEGSEAGEGAGGDDDADGEGSGAGAGEGADEDDGEHSADGSGSSDGDGEADSDADPDGESRDGGGEGDGTDSGEAGDDSGAEGSSSSSAGSEYGDPSGTSPDSDMDGEVSPGDADEPLEEQWTDAEIEELIRELEALAETEWASAEAGEAPRVTVPDTEDPDPDYTAVADEIRKSAIHKSVPLRVVNGNPQPAVYEAAKAATRVITRQIVAALKPLVVRQLEDYDAGRRSGALDTRCLWRVPALKDNRVFMKRHLPYNPAVAVYLLADASGSMAATAHFGKVRMRRDDAVRLTLVALSEALEQLKVVHAVSAFDEDFYAPVVNHRRLLKFGQKSNRATVADYRACENNRDGYSIRVAVAELKKRSEPVKLLFVLSDGQPAAAGYGGAPAVTDTALAVREAKKYGIEVVGFFFGDQSDIEAERRMFTRERLIVVDNLGRLPTDIAAMFRRLVIRYRG